MTPAPKPPERDPDLWLRYAHEDLEVARRLLRDEWPPVRHVLLLAQQTVEKALKALLVWNGQEYPLTHDLGTLVQRCSAFHPEMKKLAMPAVRLTPYATWFRYPGAEEEATTAEAIELVAAAESVYRDVVRLVKGPHREPR
jgi:HEPN domain-containing protein